MLCVFLYCFWSWLFGQKIVIVTQIMISYFHPDSLSHCNKRFYANSIILWEKNETIVDEYNYIKTEFSLGLYVCLALTPKISSSVESLILEEEIQARWLGPYLS